MIKFLTYLRARNRADLLSARHLPTRIALACVGMAILGAGMSQRAFADTLGGRIQQASTDLSNGFGYALTAGGYILGAVALLTGFYVLWKHQQNANGPHKLGYGITSIIVGGAFLSITYIAGFATHTVSDAGPDNTGASASMRFDN